MGHPRTRVLHPGFSGVGETTNGLFRVYNGEEEMKFLGELKEFEVFGKE